MGDTKWERDIIVSQELSSEGAYKHIYFRMTLPIVGGYPIWQTAALGRPNAFMSMMLGWIHTRKDPNYEEFIFLEAHTVRKRWFGCN